MAAGLEFSNGLPLTMEQIFTDWIGVVKKLGRVPSVRDYAAYGTHTRKPLMKRFRVWANLPVRMLDFAERTGKTEEWRDTLELVRTHLKEPKRYAGCARVEHGEPGLREDRPVYGRPIRAKAKPTTEARRRGERQKQFATDEH